MTKIAYLDCSTGIAGDMCLGALVDLGVPLEYLIEQLNRLGISQEFKLWTESVHKNGQRATKFHVELVSESGETSDPDAFTTIDYLIHSQAPDSQVAAIAAPNAIAHTHHPSDPNHPDPHSHSHPADHAHSHSHPTGNRHNHPDPETSHYATVPIRHLPEIEQLIQAAQLPSRATAWSLAVFRRLAEAEGAVHGVSPEQVHFHEVGATDALVDIVGTCLGLDWLGIDQLYCSPLPAGGGTIRAAHGRLPVPAPAVLKLFEIRQIPIYSNGIQKEMVTPTGAALATTLAIQFGAPPTMILRKVGMGAGTRNLPLPNILRLWLGEGEG